MTRIWIGVTTLSLLIASPAQAQNRAGIRTGVSGEPGQFVLGGHVETKPVIEHLTFRPNVEIGIGESTTVVAMNLEFAYWVPIHRHPWSFYAGAGPAAILTHVSGNGGGSSIGGGFNFLVGLQHQRGLFTELKVGMLDSPSLKFLIGYTFR